MARQFMFCFFFLQRATLAEKEVNTLKEQLTTTTTSKTQTNTTLSNSTAATTITQNGTSPPSPSTTPLSLLSDNNDNHSTSNKLLNNNSIKNCHLDDENMDKKLSDVNEMIDRNQEDDDVRGTNNHCSSNRSTPVSEKERCHEQDDDDAENEDASESRDNGDRCSVNSSSVNKTSAGTRTMAEELAIKDKEVRGRVFIEEFPLIIRLLCFGLWDVLNPSEKFGLEIPMATHGIEILIIIG